MEEYRIALLSIGEYATDPWNFLDIFTYSCILASITVHVINVGVHEGKESNKLDQSMTADASLVTISVIIAWIKALKFFRLEYQTWNLCGFDSEDD